MTGKTMITATLACVLLAGCRVVPPSVRRTLAAPYQPENVYVRQLVLPEGIRRVALLPIPQNHEDVLQSAGAELLEPVLKAELAKRNAFELIQVSPQTAAQAAQGDAWAAADPLPQDFFDRLSRATGCDAVIFASLTDFKPFPPLRTAWKMRLVDCRQHMTWWAVDETFDAGVLSVAVAAEAFARSSLNEPNPLLADTGVLHSPSRFGQYTANALAATLPHR